MNANKPPTVYDLLTQIDPAADPAAIDLNPVAAHNLLIGWAFWLSQWAQTDKEVPQ